MPRGRWADIAASLVELSGELKRNGSSSDEWEARSLAKLPAGVFVWRDELVAQYERTYGRRKFLRSKPGAAPRSEADEALLDELARSGDDSALLRKEHKARAAMIELDGDGQLDFRVVMPKAQHDVVFEGFELFADRGAEPVSAGPDSMTGTSSMARPIADPGTGQTSMQEDSLALALLRTSKKRHILAPLIFEAIRECWGSLAAGLEAGLGVGQVWTALTKMAEQPNPPDPIVGRTGDGKVQYRMSCTTEEYGEYTRKHPGAFLKRLRGLG